MGAEIGCGCIHMYHQAGFIVLRNHDKDSLEYNWGIEMKFIMNDFCSWYEEKMNRYEGNIKKMYRSSKESMEVKETLKIIIVI